MIDIQEVDWYRVQVFFSYNNLIYQVIFQLLILRTVWHGRKINDLRKKHLTFHHCGS